MVSQTFSTSNWSCWLVIGYKRVILNFAVIWSNLTAAAEMEMAESETRRLYVWGSGASLRVFLYKHGLT